MSNISVKIIADSINEIGNRFTTFELEYPRVIHSELKTHRALSGNSMSSRAVPIKKMIEQVQIDPAMLSEYGKNKAGMQSAGVHDTKIGPGYTAEEWWKLAAFSAAKFAEGFDEAGYHKQVANRLIEPFQRMKTVLSGTEWNNFFWLRVDGDADPTIRALATEMQAAYKTSKTEFLLPGEWHTPYVEHDSFVTQENTGKRTLVYFVRDEEGNKVYLTTEEAKAISSSCCAQVSYRVLNSTKEKALDVYGKLLSGNKVHASPFEHQGTPMEHINQLDRFNYMMSTQTITQTTEMWQEGVTHLDREGMFWSGNVKGFIQHRQLLENNVMKG